MAIREILVPLVGVGDARRLLENAFGVATRLKAHVTACDTLPDEIPYIDTAGMLSAEAYAAIINKLESERAHARSALQHQFAVAAEHAGIAVQASAVEGRATTTWMNGGGSGRPVWGLGPLADLVIARRPVGEGIADREVVEDVLFGVRRPVLLIPPKGAHLERGAAVAWNGSLEAATALARAIDLLEPGKPCTVLQIGELSLGRLPASNAVRYLRAHGITAREQILPDRHKETGEVLLEAAGNCGAGLLVAGAYTHSRVRESLLGGVTATLLQRAHLPLLMAH